MRLSATIITLNEEKNISGAIRSLSFADEIIIVDSGSSDNTVKIAQELGAFVAEHPFEGYGQQKNYAQSLCQGEWILNIDADERVTPELKSSILNELNNPKFSLYEIPRLTRYCGEFIHHGGWYPDLKKRLGRKKSCSWTTPHVHEDYFLKKNAPIGTLSGDLLHESFPSVLSQLQVNLKYAQLGAKAFLKKKQRRPMLWELIFRPLGKFLECYVIKMGFRDGLRGYTIAINAAHSLFMKLSLAKFDEKLN